MNAAKKRGAALLLALALALSLCACGGGKADPAPADATAPAEPQEPVKTPDETPGETPDETPGEAPDETQPAQDGGAQDDAAASAEVSGTSADTLPGGPPTYTFEDGVLTCSGGGEVQAKGDDGWIKVVQNAIFSTSNDEAKAAVEKVVVEKGITAIGKSAFFEAKNLKELSLPDGLTSIGGFAFQGSNLTSVQIPDSVTEIGSQAFCECSALSSITLPRGLTCISQSLFTNCASLTSIEIPDGVTTIENGAFRGTGLTELVLPDSVTTIGQEIIQDTKITRMEIPASVEEMDNPFGVRKLTEIILHRDIPLDKIESVLATPLEASLRNGTTLTIYGPSGGVLEGWTNKQISERFSNCKFVPND